MSFHKQRRLCREISVIDEMLVTLDIATIDIVFFIDCNQFGHSRTV
jgi:hypothetical protein